MEETALEPLREVATITAGNTATALSKLIGQEVAVAVPSVKLVAIENVLTELGDVSHVSSTTLVRIKGDVRGLLLFTFDPHDVPAATTEVANQQVGGMFDGKDEAVLLETVNIISGAALSALAKFLDLDIMESVPDTTTDMIGAVLDPFIAEFGTEFDRVFILQQLFTLPDSGTSLKCITIFDPPSTATMLKKMNEKLEPGHAANN